MANKAEKEFEAFRKELEALCEKHGASTSCDWWSPTLAHWEVRIDAAGVLAKVSAEEN